jgi:hypothetical protein
LVFVDTGMTFVAHSERNRAAEASAVVADT